MSDTKEALQTITYQLRSRAQRLHTSPTHRRVALAIEQAANLISHAVATVGGHDDARLDTLRTLVRRTDWYGTRTLNRERIRESREAKDQISELVVALAIECPVTLACALDDFDADDTLPDFAVDWIRRVANGVARHHRSELFLNKED